MVDSLIYTYRNDEGVEISFSDLNQATLAERYGFKLVEEPTKRTRKPKTEE